MYSSNSEAVIDEVLPRKAKTSIFFTKLFNYEYWPVWIVFFSAIFSYIYYSVKTRSLTYFTATNPGIELGGFYGESKSEILKMIPGKYLPKTIFITPKSPVVSVLNVMRDNNIDFPVICKPDKGERGFMVEKVTGTGELEQYLKRYDGKLIIQEFVTFETELGILYYRYPDGKKSGISSVVKKNFMGVTGDGTSTIEQLMMQNPRSHMHISSFREKSAALLSEVLPAGRYVLLQPIGNHCRGTEFLNGSHLVNKKLVEVFDTIAAQMEGFYFGRFDVKIRSEAAMYNGEGIRIMEVNGVSSEPGHIYDRNMNIFKAWRAIIHNASIVGEIAIQNHKKGIRYLPLTQVIKTVYRHFRDQK